MFNIDSQIVASANFFGKNTCMFEYILGESVDPHRVPQLDITGGKTHKCK